jgi:hypothetical protein
VAFYGQNIRDKEAQNKRIKQHNKDNPAKYYLANTKSSAKQKGLDFDLDEEWFESRIKKATCELTGLPIRPLIGTKNRSRDGYSVSIDRIDNSIGYITSNTRVVAWIVNLAKNEYSDRDLNALSLAVVLSHIPKPMKQEFIDSLPHNLVASLPTGFKI